MSKWAFVVDDLQQVSLITGLGLQQMIIFLTDLSAKYFGYKWWHVQVASFGQCGSRTQKYSVYSKAGRLNGIWKTTQTMKIAADY